MSFKEKMSKLCEETDKRRAALHDRLEEVDRKLDSVMVRLREGADRVVARRSKLKAIK